jgi:hypothetical protein
MADRDLDCILCQRHFTRFCADLILPENLICDECLAELCQLEGDELRKRVSQRLAKSALQHGQEFENEIVRTVQTLKQRGTGTSINKIVQDGPSQ